MNVLINIIFGITKFVVGIVVFILILPLSIIQGINDFNNR